MKAAGATVELQDAFRLVLREVREQLIQRLVSAGADPRHGERLIWNAIDELIRTATPRVRLPDFQRRLLSEVNRQCQIFAELRGFPYGRLEPVLRCHWSELLDIARKAGLEWEEAYSIVREMIWKHGTRWAASKNPETEILTGLRYALYVVGLAGKELAAEALPLPFERRRDHG